MQQLPIIVNVLVAILTSAVVAYLALLAAKRFGDVPATNLLMDYMRGKEQEEAERYKRLLSEEIEANLWALRLVRELMSHVSEGDSGSDMIHAHSLVTVPQPALSSEIWDRRTPSLMKLMLGRSGDALALYQKFRQMREITSALHVVRRRRGEELANNPALGWSSWDWEAGKLSKKWRELADSAEAQGNPLAEPGESQSVDS